MIPTVTITLEPVVPPAALALAFGADPFTIPRHRMFSARPGRCPNGEAICDDKCLPYSGCKLYEPR